MTDQTGLDSAAQQNYADDRNLRLRQRLFDYAVPSDRTYVDELPWTGREWLLDAGCGNGRWLNRLLAEGRAKRGVAVDRSPGMLATVPGDVLKVCADVRQLPFPERMFDTVLAMHMLYHVPEPATAVAELRRVLAPGGHCLVTTNSRDHLPEAEQLFAECLAAVTGRPPARLLPPLAFDAETGGELLEQSFESVERHDFAEELAVPDAEVVVGLMESLRDPVEAVHGPVAQWDAVLAEVGRRVGEVIADAGEFRTTARSAAFVCR
jgi:ubiquinone/menaquinone biosynthesis C-methylase UbiE